MTGRAIGLLAAVSVAAAVEVIVTPAGVAAFAEGMAGGAAGGA